MNQTKKISYIALITSLALIISLVESTLPAPFAFAPGAKLGLANLITVLAIFTLKKREVSLFLFSRLLLQMLIGGGASTFLYSLAGAVLSCIAMLLAKWLGPKKVSVIGISCIGGFFHNVGQLIVASLIAGTWAVLNYLPIISILGILSGFFVGICGNYLLKNIQQLRKAHLIMENKKTSEWFDS